MVIYRHNCRLCGIQIYEEPFELNEKVYVEDICNKCIDKKKGNYREDNERLVVGLKELKGEERDRYFNLRDL